MPTEKFANERAALANAWKLSQLLQPAALAKLNSAIAAVTRQVMAPAGANALISAQHEIQQLFPQATPDQVTFLSLCVVAQVTTAPNVSISLQRENRLFASISNVLKTSHDIDSGSISNIK